MTTSEQTPRFAVAQQLFFPPDSSTRPGGNLGLDYTAGNNPITSKARDKEQVRQNLEKLRGTLEDLKKDSWKFEAPRHTLF